MSYLKAQIIHDEELAEYVDKLNATTGSVRILDAAAMEQMQKECEDAAYAEWAETIAKDPGYVEWRESLNHQEEPR